MFIKLYDSFEKVLYQRAAKEVLITKPKESQSRLNFMKFLDEAKESGVDLNKVDLSFSIHRINHENNLTIEQIMVVDDDEIQLNNYILFLTRLGHYVEGYNSAELALKAFTTDPTRYTCLFTDNHMGEMNGCQLSKKVKALAPNIKVWIITGELGDVDDDIFDSEIEASIAKPIRIATFIGTVGVADSKHSSANASFTNEDEAGDSPEADEPPPIPKEAA